MKLFKILYILSVCAGLCSCNTRKLDDLNSAPTIGFLVGLEKQASIEDSVKISLKSVKNYADITLSVSDENMDIQSISYSAKGDVKVMQDGQVRSGTIDLYSAGADNIALQVYPQSSQTASLTFTVKDQFGETATAVAMITSFENLPPMAMLQVNKIDIEDDLHYQLDARGSYDRDALYGGGIQVYEYYINDQVITLDPSFDSNYDHPDFIFGQRGNYFFKLRVMDTDGKWSEVEFNKSIN